MQQIKLVKDNIHLNFYMSYHYSSKKYRQYYDDIKLLQEKVMEDMAIITKQIQSRLPDVKVCWTRRNGLGCVFTDLDESRLGSKLENGLYSNGRLIGNGEAALSREIQNRYNYILFSNRLRQKTEPNVEINGEKILVVNIDRFKKIMEGKSDRQNVVRIFLEPDPPEDLITLLEKLLRQAKDENMKIIMSKLEYLFYRFKIEENEDLQLMIRIITQLLLNLKVENPDILKNIPDLSSISELIVRTHTDYFNKQLNQFKTHLDEFEKMIGNNEKEKHLQELIKLNPWILDFKYFEYPSPEKEKEIAIGEDKTGFADLFFHKERFGTHYITIVEFKKPDVRITGTSYGGEQMPSILSPVVKALSQLIHYIENALGKSYNVEGILVIGKKNSESDEFINTFSKYLHGITITTYDQLLETASGIVAALQGKNDNSIT